MRSCALVSKSGSIDWCCLPRFDSASVFGRILDWQKGGYFQVSPLGVRNVTRQYLPETNILETTFETDTGVARLTDFMSVHPNVSRAIDSPDNRLRNRILRILECTSGSVHFKMKCYPRFAYGAIAPHAGLETPYIGMAHGGSDAIVVHCSFPMDVADYGFRSSGSLASGEKLYTTVAYLEHGYSHEVQALVQPDFERLLRVTTDYWRQWSSISTYRGVYGKEVMRSALTLKALTYEPSGGFVAAPTTSIPEAIGGPRNWDYRYTWIRDATFGLYALHILGYTQEAQAFKRWLEWSTVGRARDLQIMYGVGGERRLMEMELTDLCGYRHSRPVRIGNGAHSQFQLDIYGEILDSAHLYRKYGGELDSQYWEFLQRVVNFVINHWQEPDDGIWETRSGRQHFVFSKVMCWVALDRAIKAARALDLPGDVQRWKTVRAEIRHDVMTKGYDAERGVFVQAYGSKLLDSANLMLPLVHFIKASDPKMRSTIEATRRELTSPQGFVYRYKAYDDGLASDEGTFTICTLWLADNLILLGEVQEARDLFEKLCANTNDLGLLSEQIDAESGELLGNFPQAFSHLAIINTAYQLNKAMSRESASTPDHGIDG